MSAAECDGATYLRCERCEEFVIEGEWLAHANACGDSESDAPQGGREGNPLWDRDDIQFPRLLATLKNAGIPDACMEDVVNSMDIEYEDLAELFDRANKVWARVKHCTGDTARNDNTTGN
jgi:hypothetical protein